MPRLFRPVHVTCAPTLPLADAAVAMRPRNKQRLTRGGAAVGVVAVVATLGLWFSGGGPPFGHSSSHSDSSKRVLLHSFQELIPYQDGLPYGMTKQQMIHRLGKPEKVAGQCFQYSENFVTWTGKTINAVRMCFWTGQYQGWFIEMNGIWNTPGIFKAISPPTTVTAQPLNKTLPDWSKLPHAPSGGR